MTGKVWQLAWPSILSNLVFTTVGFIHMKMAAGLGTADVAAVTTGHRIYFLLQAVMMGLSIATTALVSRSWGANQQAQADRFAWHSLALAGVLGLALTLPAVLIPGPITSMFQLEPAAASRAADFIFWLGIFTFFSAINMTLASALRATGDVLTPLYFLVASGIVNVMCAYVLLSGLGPFPSMGVAGIALGSGFGSTVVTLVFVACWWRGKLRLTPPLHKAIDQPVMRQIVSTGTPAMLEQGVVQLVMMLFFIIIAGYGLNAYAAFGIGVSLVSFTIVIGFGFGIAAATLVGQQLGAGSPKGAVKAGTRALRLGVAVMTLLSILVALGAESLAAFMTPDPETRRLTRDFIYVIAIAQPFMAVDFTLAGSLRGAGDTRSPLVATVCGLVFGRLIPAWLFATLGLSVYWVFAVMVTDYMIKGLLLAHRFRSGRWLNIRYAQVGAPISRASLDSDE